MPRCRARLTGHVRQLCRRVRAWPAYKPRLYTNRELRTIVDHDRRPTFTLRLRGRLDFVDAGGSDADDAGAMVIDHDEQLFFEVLEDPARFGIIEAEFLADRRGRNEFTDASVDDVVEQAEELAAVLTPASHRLGHAVSFSRCTGWRN
jgi:hypothetical protein